MFCTFLLCIVALSGLLEGKPAPLSGTVANVFETIIAFYRRILMDSRVPFIVLYPCACDRILEQWFVKPRVFVAFGVFPVVDACLAPMAGRPVRPHGRLRCRVRPRGGHWLPPDPADLIQFSPRDCGGGGSDACSEVGIALPVHGGVSTLDRHCRLMSVLTGECGGGGVFTHECLWCGGGAG